MAFYAGRGGARGRRNSMPTVAGYPGNLNINRQRPVERVHAHGYDSPYWQQHQYGEPPSGHFPVQHQFGGPPNRHFPVEYHEDWQPQKPTDSYEYFQQPPFYDDHGHYSEANWKPDGPYRPDLNKHPPTNLERYALFERLLRCGEKSNGKTYLAIYWLEFSDLDDQLTSPLFENEAGGHAEEYLLKHLQLQLRVIHRERLKSVTIMQNASPCSGCAKSYKEALEDVPGKDSSDVQVVIIFSAFHWLRRLSCRHQNHQHKFISKKRHEENREGLRQLCQAGFTVRTTCYEDWTRLCTSLQVPRPQVLWSKESYRISPRGQQDHDLKDDLKEILS